MTRRRSRALGLATFVALAATLAIAALVWRGPLGVAAAGEAERPGRPLPRFSGRTFDGERLGTDALSGRRALLYVFASTDTDADEFASVVQSLRSDARDANVFVLGINRDLDTRKGLEFAVGHSLDFPVLHDADLAISQKLKAPPGESMLLLVDGSGWVFGGIAGFDERVEEPERYYERSIREALHIDRPGDTPRPELGLLPEAPAFRVKTLEGEELSSASLRDRAVVLVFFLPTCPHCHELLAFLERLNRKLSAQPLSIVAVSVQNRRYTIQEMARKLDLSFAPYVDPTKEAQEAYGFSSGVPDTVVIDRQGRIFSRRTGSGSRIEALLTMEVQQALGLPNAILLEKAGYSGSDACRVCHTSQHDTWSLTNHAYAFETLAEHAQDRNPECLECHTVGFDEPGGYSVDEPLAFLEGVQCESCHGRGGPHQSPGFVANGFGPVCETCHTETHSLQFQLAKRLPLVSHAANLQFAQLSLEERQQLLERRDKRERTLFGGGEFVGSETCRTCHAPQHEIWQASPHAHAFATLERTGDHQNESCVSCHTTGHGMEGGYPDGGPGLRDVGCESCHGPGGEHVKEDVRKKGSILFLTDKCDSCVILQICGSCHDDANDENFEFELLDKLERIRHGMAATSAE